MPARPSSSNSAVSTLVSTAPACSIFARPIRLESAKREATASSATWTSVPPASRSSTVWLTQTCVSIPQTSAWSRPPRSKPSASAAEKTVFSSGSDPAGRGSATSGAVAPSPFGYCSVMTTGTSIASAPRISVAVARVTSSKSRHRLAEGLLHVDHDQRRALSIEPSHAAAPMAKLRWRKATWPAATVISTRPVSVRPAKQLLCERLS